MKKIGIISSYKDICGIASYAKSIVAGFKDAGYEMKVLELNQTLLHSRGEYFQKLGDEHIDEICREIYNLDSVNIQMEFGLFGESIKNIKSRVKKIVNACKGKKVCLTLHTIHCTPLKEIFTEAFKNIALLRVKSAFHSLRKVREGLKTGLLAWVVQEVVRNGGTVIVHTERDRRIIEGQYGEKTDNIISYPLCFHVPRLTRERRQEIRKKVRENRGIEEGKILIGIFGFISPYKGTQVAIEMIKKLPEEYVLGIFGGQHPSSIKAEPHGSAYTESILKNLDRKKGVSNRVFFYGVADYEEEFANNMIACDHIVLPYHEVGQSGSGVASLAIALNEKVYLSRTNAFIELAKYFKDSFYFFDIGNYMELSQKIINSDNDIKNGRKYALEVYNIKNNISIYKNAMDIIK